MAARRIPENVKVFTGIVVLMLMAITGTAYVVSSATSHFDSANATGVVTKSDPAPLLRRVRATSTQYIVSISFVDHRGNAITADAIVEGGLRTGDPVEVVYSKRSPTSIHVVGQERAAWNLYWPWALGLTLFLGLLAGVIRQTRRAHQPASASPISED